MKLLLLGATGLVGSRTLKLALADGSFSKIIAPTRQPLPPADRLVNPVAANLEELFPEVMAYQPHAVICALGTTSAQAGSKKAFQHIDRDLPVAWGRSAHVAGAQTYAMVSAMGASPDAKSFYYRTKGELEREIQSIGFRSLTICRPSLIGGERHETRPGEKAALVLLRLLKPVLPKKLRVNPAGTIAASLLDAVVHSRAGSRWIYAEELI